MGGLAECMTKRVVERVIFALQQRSPITWIVGSPLAYDAVGKRGVLGVNGVVELITPVLEEIAQTALRELTDREKALHEDFFPEWKAERIFRQWGKSPA
jgi:hypothetical protein